VLVLGSQSTTYHSVSRKNKIAFLTPHEFFLFKRSSHNASFAHIIQKMRIQ